MKYSINKGLVKGGSTALMIALAFVTFAGFADFTIWELIEQYIKPLIGSITVGALIKLIINYIKIKATVEDLRSE